MKTYQKMLISAPLLVSAIVPGSVLAYMGSATQGQYQNQNQVQTQTQEQVQTETQTQVQNQDVTPTQAQVRAGFLNQLKLKLAQRVQSRIRSRLQNQFQKLEKNQATIEAKLAEKKQAGLDVSQVEAKLTELSSIKANYQTYLSEYDQVVTQMNQSDNPVKFRNELQNKARLANQELNKYRQTLVQAIRLMINLTKTT